MKKWQLISIMDLGHRYWGRSVKSIHDSILHPHFNKYTYLAQGCIICPPWFARQSKWRLKNIWREKSNFPQLICVDYGAQKAHVSNLIKSFIWHINTDDSLELCMTIICLTIIYGVRSDFACICKQWETIGPFRLSCTPRGSSWSWRQSILDT